MIGTATQKISPYQCCYRRRTSEKRAKRNCRGFSIFSPEGVIFCCCRISFKWRLGDDDTLVSSTWLRHVYQVTKIKNSVFFAFLELWHSGERERTCRKGLQDRLNPRALRFSHVISCSPLSQTPCTSGSDATFGLHSLVDNSTDKPSVIPCWIFN